MSSKFDGPSALNDSDFLTVRFRDTLPENHPVRFIDKFIDSISVTSFEKKYHVGVGKKGRSPKDVRLMLKVILYAIYCRIYSARKVDYATEHYADFWFFTHAKRISHDKISSFIIMHGKDLHTVFLETVDLAHNNDLLSFDALYQDGFKIKSNASKQRNYNQKGLCKKKIILSENLTHIIEQLHDNKEDEFLIKEKKILTHKLAKIGELRDELLNRIAQRSKNKPTIKKKKLAEKAVINSTDSDSELMRQKDRSYANSYLKITGTDNKADIVVASMITGYDYEACTSLPLFDQANENLNDIESSQTYDTAIADSGFTTMGNCDAYEHNGAQLFGPTQAFEAAQHKDPANSAIKFTLDAKNDVVYCSEGNKLTKDRRRYRNERDAYVNLYCNKEACRKCPEVKACTKSKNGYRSVMIDPRLAAQQRAITRYCSKEGQKLYKKRSHVAETYQGDLKQNGRLTHYMLRGIRKVRIESRLHDIIWNLRRVFSETNDKTIVWSM